MYIFKLTPFIISLYPMITHIPLIQLVIKSFVARQQPTTYNIMVLYCGHRGNHPMVTSRFVGHKCIHTCRAIIMTLMQCHNQQPSDLYTLMPYTYFQTLAYTSLLYSIISVGTVGRGRGQGAMAPSPNHLTDYWPESPKMQATSTQFSIGLTNYMSYKVCSGELNPHFIVKKSLLSCSNSLIDTKMDISNEMWVWSVHASRATIYVHGPLNIKCSLHLCLYYTGPITCGA